MSTRPKHETSVGGFSVFFPKEEYEQRWSRLHAEMAKRNFDTAVVWQRTGGSYDRAGNVWYLSNYAAQNIGQEPSTPYLGIGQALAALLVRQGEEPELHVLGAETGIEGIERQYVAVDHIEAHPGSLATGLAAHLTTLGIEGRVAYVGDDFLPVEMWRPLVAGTPLIEWVPQDDLLSPLQHVKSPRELDLFREAGEISSRALTAFMEGLIRGDRQCDAAAEAAAIITAAGGGFQRLGCHTGPRGDTSLFDYPLYGYSKESAKPGELVHAWVIPVIEGYWLDPGRTSVYGATPTNDQKRLIESTVEVCERVADALTPGATPREVGVIADRAAEKLGLEVGTDVTTLYGHGMSTFWSGPVIPGAHTARVEADPFWNIDEPFYNGQLFTVEAFFSEPGVGLAGIEDILIIWDDGVEWLTDSPKTFW